VPTSAYSPLFDDLLINILNKNAIITIIKTIMPTVSKPVKSLNKSLNIFIVATFLKTYSISIYYITALIQVNQAIKTKMIAVVFENRLFE